MKELILSKRNKLIALAMVFIAALLATSAVSAHSCRYKHCKSLLLVRGPISVPTATCNVGNNTQLQIPQYVCCKKVVYSKNHRHWHVAWKNKWVSGDCSNVWATKSLGCTTQSNVYGTGAPIMASCQFSASTNRYR